MNPAENMYKICLICRYPPVGKFVLELAFPYSILTLKRMVLQLSQNEVQSS